MSEDDPINISIGDKDEETIAGVLKAKITPELLMDLYDQHRDMEEGLIKDGFLATVKIFEEYLGGYLMLEDKSEDKN